MHRVVQELHVGENWRSASTILVYSTKSVPWYYEPSACIVFANPRLQQQVTANAVDSEGGRDLGRKLCRIYTIPSLISIFSLFLFLKVIVVISLHRMKFQALLLLAMAACVSAFMPAGSRAMPLRRVEAKASKFDIEAMKAAPALLALTAAAPAHAFEASYLPPILVPLVGLVIPGTVFALAFIWTQIPIEDNMRWNGAKEPDFMTKWKQGK